MAAENLINLVTDRFNPEVIQALKSNLGIDAFSGQSTSTADMTGAGWLCVAALNTIKDETITFDDDDIKSILKEILDSKDSSGIVLKYQINSKGDNLLMQLINYYANSTVISLSDIISLMEYLFDNEDVKNILKATNSADYSAAMVISYTDRYIRDNGNIFHDYFESFIDLSYPNNSNLLPIARLMIRAISDNDIKDYAISAINDIIAKAIEDYSGDEPYEKFNSVFLPFPYSTTEQADNSIIEYIYSIGTDLLKKDLTDDNGVLSNILSLVLSKPTDILSVVLNSVNVEKCIGIRYGETGFSLASYKSNALQYDPRIDASFHIVNRLGASTVKNDVFDYFTPFLFPIPENAPIEGYTLIGKLSENISIGDNNETLVDSDILDIATKYLTESNKAAKELGGDDNLKKFFVLNAILGTCRDFTDNSTMNVYGPINIIFNTINKAHKAWCTANNKSFDDYKDKYDSIVTSLFGGDECVGFDTAYKYWCNEYDKMF